MKHVQAGFAKVKITPPMGTLVCGYYFDRISDAVHDDLYARALVLDDGKRRWALVACDLALFSAEVAQAARALIERESGLPPEAVLIHATHTHTGPVVDGAYAEGLPEHIARSVRIALEGMREVRIGVGFSEEQGLSFNRRFFMKGGGVTTNPGKLNPDIVEPEGPIDPEVAVVSIEEPDGSPVALLVRFGMHLDTISGTAISADYPCFLEQALSEKRGQDLPMMFLKGCSGNTNHFDVHSSDPQRSFGEAERIGRTLVRPVSEAMDRLTYLSDVDLGCARQPVRLPCRISTEKEVAWAREIVAQPADATKDFTMDRVAAIRIIQVSEMEKPYIPAEVQILRVGDLAIAGFPTEMFVEWATQLREDSPFRYTLPIDLANGSVGYIPTREAFENGGYEPVSSVFTPDVGDVLVGAALDLLNAQ
ncbi:MAG: hypothetical protein KAJ81_02995 [Candidatus Latescibacteria bacterium]|nr:hypothetical protein [Candidatus Latescibacterota bacterium]